MTEWAYAGLEDDEETISHYEDIKLRDERIEQLEKLNATLAARIDELEAEARA